MNPLTSRRAAIGLLAAASAAPTVLRAAESPPAPFTGAFVREHLGEFGGRRIAYRSIVASTVVPTKSGAPGANVVTTSYVRTDAPNPARRPVIFAWNGGPGGPSLSYHTRFMGPRRIPAKDPTVFAPNPEALLDIADVIFVDPPETGFSRILPGAERKDFYSVAGDAAALTFVIDAWSKEHGRTESPLMLMGSSYGTVRAIRMGWEMRKTRPLAGLILTANSGMVQETVRANSVIGYGANLSSQTMTALYHGKIARRGRSDAQIIEEAWTFGMGEYLGALARVQELAPAQRKAIAARLQDLTGIGADYFLENNLAIESSAFSKLLLQDKGLVLAEGFDGRVTASSAAPPTDFQAPQPSALFGAYLKDELGVPWDVKDYVPFAPGVDVWDFSGPNGASSNNWPSMLVQQMREVPNLRVYSANGYYDMMSTMGQARYLFSRMPAPRDRVTVRAYPGEHGLYLGDETASRVLADLRRFLAPYVAA